MSWDKMCQPKEGGGLNFRDLEIFNQALLAKQVWRMLKGPHLLVSRFLNGCYFPDSDILTHSPHSSISYLWKAFQWGRELLLKGIRIRVGNGRGTHVNDKWLPREITFKLISPCFDGADLKDSEFMTASKQWNIKKSRQFVIKEEDVEIIRRIPSSWTEIEDV